jgi:L-serine dehydratase
LRRGSRYDRREFNPAKIESIQASQKLLLKWRKEINIDVQFLVSETLPFHPNGLSFLASCENNAEISETFYSIGGGFVVKENEDTSNQIIVDLPFPINTSETCCTGAEKPGSR